MDFAVPAELDEVRASFLAFIDREVRPVEERFRAELQEDRWTDEMRDAAGALRKKSAEIGYYGAHLPEEVGGWGLSTLGYTLLVEAGSATGLRFTTAVLMRWRRTQSPAQKPMRAVTTAGSVLRRPSGS